jgi:tetratricopeptide (TPR) repeat protein
MSQARSTSLAIVGLAVLTVLAYGPLWRNDFIDYDDDLYIIESPHVRGGLSWDNIEWAWTTFHAANWHPLTWMSLQLDGTLFRRHDLPPHPIGTHAVNLAWHLATTLLLFAFLRRATGREGPSLVVAALFAVHPLHVESVAWATERKDALSTFFWALALWAYAAYAQRPGVGRYLLVVLAMVLGLLAKPMLVTLPCTLLLLDYWPLRRARWAPPGGNGDQSAAAPDPSASTGWLLLEKLPLFAISAVASIVTVAAQSYGNAVVPLEVVPLPVRLGHLVTSYIWYLEKTFWPVGLTVFYPHDRAMPSIAALAVGGAILLTITLAAVLGARRRPWLIVGWLWFLGTLVPVIGLMQVGNQATADRYSYVPHIGLFIALVWSLSEVFSRWHLSAVVQRGLAVTCLAVLAALTWRQVGHWQDTEALWRHALEVTPNNPVACVNLARELMIRAHRARELALSQAVAGAQEEAEALSADAQALAKECEALCVAAVAAQPDVARYHYTLGIVLLERGQLDKAFDQFAETVIREKDYADAWHNMGVVRLRQGRYPQAVKNLEQALACRPQAPDTHAGLGHALWHLGRREEAEAHWKQALALSRREPEARAGMALVLLRQGKHQEAEEALKSALKARPGMASAYGSLGIALGRSGKWREAVAAHQVAAQVERQRANLSGSGTADLGLALRRLAFALHMLGRADQAAAVWKEAARAHPQGPQTDVRTAWALATSPSEGERDPQTAYELARCACELSPGPPAEALDALAAAQAALGRFEIAAATARQARAKATGDLREQIGARVKLYEQGRPFLDKKG